MALTLAEAAQQTGLNRSTVLRAIKSGRISGNKDELGQWSVEPAELFRVFAPAEASSQGVHQDAQGEAAELRRRAEAAEAIYQFSRRALWGLCAANATYPRKPRRNFDGHPISRRLRVCRLGQQSGNADSRG